MSKRTPENSRMELLQGTLDLLILQVLRRAPEHGYGIGQAIRSGTNELLQIETGSLYPALHRLERQGWVKSEWGTTGNNQRAKYYRLTDAGRKQLKLEQSRWNQMTDAIGRLLNPTTSNEGQA